MLQLGSNKINQLAKGKPHLDGATVRVVAVLEELAEELLVEAVDRVVEGQHDELGGVLGSEISGNISPAAVAVGYLAVARVAGFSLLLAFGAAHSHEE